MAAWTARVTASCRLAIRRLETQKYYYMMQWQWEYRYSAGGERESKRHVADPWEGAYSGRNRLWTYYLLGGSKQQLAVYNGRETTETNV